MTGSKCLTKKEDLVFVETIDPGIACAYVVKGTYHNKPAFVNELVKALKNEDKIVQELGVNAMTYRKLDDEGNECLLYDGYPVRMFLKYLEDHDTYKEDTVQFGEDVAAVLNTFQYKYSNKFVFGGDLTLEEANNACNKLLFQDVKKYSQTCYGEHILDGSFFYDEFLMSSLFGDETDPKRFFSEDSFNSGD